MDAALELVGSGGSTVHAYLQLSTDWVAEGEGNRRGDAVRIELTYDSGCPGTMTLTGRWDPNQARLAGDVQASDCTGRAEGTFAFSPSTPFRYETSRGGTLYK